MMADRWAYASRWRGIHPAEKALFSAACVTAALVSVSYLLSAAIALVCIALAVRGAGVPLRAVLRSLLVPEAFLVWSCLALAVTPFGFHGAAPAGSLALPLGFAMTPEGVSTALGALVRSTCALSALLLYALSTPMADTIHLLRGLRAPALLLDIMSLVYRQIFVFADTAARVRVAQSSRLGFVNARATRRSLAMVGGHLLATTFQRTRRATQGLLARGYEGELRYLPPQHTLSATNLAIGGGAGAVLVAAALLIR